MHRFCSLLFLTSVTLGCGGVSVTPNPAPVAISGSVTLGGKPISDICINFQPTVDGLPAVVTVKDGKLEAEITPGTYTYFVTKASTPTGEKSLARIPAGYLQGSMDRQFDVNEGGPLEFSMN